MYCIHCGNEIADDSAFCPNCGKPVAEAGDTAPGTPADSAGEAEDTAFEPKTPQPAGQPTAQMPVIGPEDAAGHAGAQPAQTTQSNTGTSTPPNGKKGLGTGAKIGIAVAIVAAVVVIALAVFFVVQSNRTVTVSFETDSGTAVSSEEVKPGDQVLLPADLAENARYGNWYYDAQCTREAQFPFPAPDEDIALYAKSKITISFETGGGSSITPIEVAPGDQVVSPSTPERSGYYFEGWYYDSACTQKVDPPFEAPGNDIVLYAKWESLSAGDSSEAAGSGARQQTDSEAVVGELKGYFSDMKKMSGKIATAADHFNAGFKKSAAARQEVRDELDTVENEIYDSLADTYGGSWRASSMDVPASMASTRDKMATASDKLLDRVHAMSWALDAIDNMYDPTSAQIDEAVAGYMKDSGRAYKSYKKLEKAIGKNLS